MTTPELIEFVKNDIASGVPRSVIVDKLKMQGWDDGDVIEVFDIVTKSNPSVSIPSDPVKLSDQPQSFNPINTISTGMNTKGQSNKKSKYIISTVVLVLVVFGIYVGYASSYFTSPAKILTNFMSSSKNHTGVTINLHSTLTSKNTTNFDVKGSFDFSDKKNIKFNNSISIKSDKVEALIDTRALNGSFYLSLAKISGLDSLSLKSFENKWISLPYVTDGVKLADNPLLSGANIGKDLFDNITPTEKQHLSDLVKNASFIKITKRYLPSMVDGSLTYHVDFDLDRVGITSFFNETTSYLKSINKNTPELSSLNEAYYNKMISSIKDFKGEIWIGSFDNLPRKIIVNSTLVDGESIEKSTTKFSMTMLFTDWDKPVTVVTPTDSTKIENLISSMFGVASTSGVDDNVISSQTTNLKPENPVDSQKKNIMKTFKSVADAYFIKYKNVYTGFCKSKNDGGYKIAITLPANSIYKCVDDDKSFASWVGLSDKSYYCTDSTGFSNVVKSLPKGTSCSK